MKKLMTVVSVAATLLAFGAVYGDGLTSTGFETQGSNPAYVAGQGLNTAKDDAGAVAGDTDFAATWVETELEDGVATVTAYGGEGAAVAADVAAATGVAVADLGNNYLKLDGAPLISRYAQAQEELELGTTNAVSIGDGLYIDTLVQFSAADPETPPTSAEGDKLCIWLADNEEDPTQCTLMITAGFVKDDWGFIDPTNYVTTKTLENNSWHRLQVKVLRAIDSEGTGLLSDGFVVFIDGAAVATTTCPINEEYVGDFVLNARAQRYMTAGSYSLFPSLVQQGGAGEGEITSLSFQGSGAVDNIAFTQGADIDPIEVTIPTAKLGLVTDGVTSQTGVTYDEDLEGVAFELDGDAPAQIDAGEYTTTFKLFVGYAWVGGSTEDYDVDWSIAAGGGDSGFDGGEAGKTFTIDSTTKAALEDKLPTGKTLGDVADAATGMTYAQAYALGLFNEETGEIEELDATISVGADGKVTVTLANAPTTGYVVQCKVYEKASLTAEWPSTPVATYTYGSEQAFTPGSATAGFYKVVIVISNAL